MPKRIYESAKRVCMHKQLAAKVWKLNKLHHLPASASLFPDITFSSVFCSVKVKTYTKSLCQKQATELIQLRWQQIFAQATSIDTLYTRYTM